VILIEPYGFKGAGVITKATAEVEVSQTDFGIQLGFTEYRIQLSGTLRQAQSRSRANLYTEWVTIVFFCAPIAPVPIKIESGSAHPDDAMLDVSRLDYLVRAYLDAFLTTDTSCSQAIKILSTRRTDKRSIPSKTYSSERRQGNRSANSCNQ
jgi:hypothetical protein